MSAAHTPGPWFVAPADKWVMPDGAFAQWGRYDISAGSADSAAVNYYRVASASNVSNSDANEANARLMASAPDLLAALQEVLPMLESLLFIQGDPEPGSIGHAARAAIAKATGSAL